MWFNTSDLEQKKIIIVDDLHGYVLPHAGTTFTGGIISHTLRFRPAKSFKKVLIIYYPASEKPDVSIDGKEYFHEYYVPWKAMETIFNDVTITYEGYNAKGSTPTASGIAPEGSAPTASGIVVVSADFSHFFPDFHNALEQENKAAHALMFRRVHTNTYANVVDNLASFKVLYDLIPPDWLLQWVGRTMSSGTKAVGYLSFLLRENKATYTASAKVKSPSPDGMFVTVFSDNMTARECLGEWFNKKRTWNLVIEQDLVKRVLEGGRTTSRLTGQTELDVPLTNYTITYLYLDRVNAFIRGWHGVWHQAFYLPEVFLENTFENGKWIKAADKEWPANIYKVPFKLNETLKQLNFKAQGFGGGGSRKRTKKTKKRTKNRTRKIKGGGSAYDKSGSTRFYSSRVAHYTI